jgi:hypothetical protein
MAKRGAERNKTRNAIVAEDGNVTADFMKSRNKTALMVMVLIQYLINTVDT